MASKSGGGRSAGINFSSMKQPPLIKQLKGILSEYPDGGQILKELIQNAEDADATVVKIEYDSRRINDETNESTPEYTKFFKGPALCVYNDAVFKDNDWDGIRMIYSSVKEDDPLKVGRFGLGFKSVFHITDYPSVLSGDNLLMIDPQQPSDRVNAMVSLSSIEQLEDSGLPTAAFLSAFNNKFGLTQECIRNGHFKGTIFRFPLREKKSELSETLYNEKKVLGLFDDFKSDSSSILVFLKNLECVNVLVTGEDNVSEIFTSVSVLDNEGDIRKSRLKFKNRLNELDRNFDGDDIVHEVQMTIRTTTKEISTDADWAVVNYYVGKNASHEFRTLIEDTNLGYSPYVGVAYPISRNNVAAFEGHLFCFLPLPKEGAKLTGLPVHVNGYFALSQNRHHLKLETDEQHGKQIDDKSILWNRHLIQEAIPKAYCKLILKLIRISMDLGNSRRMLDTVYHCLPQNTKTSARWQGLEIELFKSLETLPILHAEHKNSWVTISEGCFATFSSLPVNFKHVIESVKRCMNHSELVLVEAPSIVFETVKLHFKKVKDIRPDLLAKHLHLNDAYKTMNTTDKTDVLMYLLSDKDCFEKLNGLELLPLESGKWITFNNIHDTLYMCDEEITNILLGLEHQLVLRMERLGTTLYERMYQLCDEGCCQIQRLNDEGLVKLIEKCIKLHRDETSTVCITDSSELSVHWLKSVWKYIIKNKIIHLFRDKQIVPKLTVGTWENPQSIDLIRIRDIVLVSSIPKASINSNIVRCFGKMGVTIIELPDWIPMNDVKSFFFWPTFKGILALLEYIYEKTEWQKAIDGFNSTCGNNDRVALVQFLSEYHHPMNETVKKLLKKLEIFYFISCISEEGRFSTFDETQNFILDTVKFPENMPLPFSCCLGNSTTERLLTEIGGRKLELQELVLTKLKSLQDVTSSDEIADFMQYIIYNFHLFQMNSKIIDTASRVPFLLAGSKRLTPGELFDPSDPILKDMLYDEVLLPETKGQPSAEYIRVLRLIGLKNVDQINTEILFQVARSLDVWSKSGNNSKNEEYFRKATAFIEFLKRRPSVLNESCNTGNALYKCIGNLECIVIDKHNPHYPKCLTWYRHNNKLCEPTQVKTADLSLFVGASMPVTTCTEKKLNSIFGWVEQPNLKTVFVQLKTVKQYYSVQSRPDLMPSIKALYDHLFQRVADVRHVMDVEGLIWTGEGFQKANIVTITKQIGDLDLTPYIYNIPSEFEIYHELFEALGCPQNQNIEVLQDALQLVQSCHISRQDDHVVKRDQRLVCSILDRIAYLIKNGENTNVDNLLVMVHDDNKSSLVMHPSSKCAYDDDPEFFYEDTGSMHLVHEMISVDTVEILGIKSITKKALLDAEGLGIEEWEQNEHLTTRISSLLRDGYTDGLSVPKELIQNADDAGATTIKFLYDERQNSDAMQRLFSRGMTSFQGPALWVFNDAQFSQDDLKNITKLNGATKQQDVKKIGKFGLGFCSVYNLTDIPSFLTGTNLIYFDPHENHLGKILRNKTAGLKYTLPNRTLITRHVDQFKPYHGVFNCDILADNFKAYPGTLFRLPLRTEQQARESKICAKSYTVDEMKALLMMLMTNAGNLLLFSQNIRSIDLYHLSENAANPKDAHLIYKVEKESLKLIDGSLSPLGKSVLSRVPQILENEPFFSETHRTIIRQTFPGGKGVLFSDLHDLPANSDTTWLTSWAMGFGSSFDMYRKLLADGAVPLASVSVPCVSETLITPLKISTELPVGFYANGHIFCFLPLPIKTNLPVHINGCFSVTSDRRQLVHMSEDDKSSPLYQWNRSLLEDALVSAHINLLVTIADGNVDEQYKFHELWPLKRDTFIDSFTCSFYKRIISDNAKVFKGCGTWVSFENVCFIELSVRKSHIGDIALCLLSRFPPRQNKVLIDIPESVISNITAWNSNNQKICSKEIKMEELLLIFLQNIEDPFWDEHFNERIMLIETALTSTEKNVKVMMQTIDCIPTEPNQTLRNPSNLVHPHSLLASMFFTEEEVFPLNTPLLRQRTCLQELKHLGMCEDVLPTRVLIERCETVQTLLEHCNVCALDRLNNIIRYLSQYNIRMRLEMERENLQIISDLFMVPVLSKPRKWKFSWKADIEDENIIFKSDDKKCKLHYTVDIPSLLLTKPRLVFRQKIRDFVGIDFLILNEKTLSTNVSEALNLLSVKDTEHVTVEMIVNQITTLSNEYREPTQLGELLRLHNVLLSKLDQMWQSDEFSVVKHLERISTKAVILIGKELLEPKKVAFNVKQECKPYLYKLPINEQLIRKRLYFSLGVKDHFDVETIINVMDQLGKNGDPDISLVNNLLINLDDVISKSGTTFDEIKNYHERVLAPDTEGKLCPTHLLVTENENFQTGIPLKILHPAIAPSLGEKLGVKVKQLRCFEEISCGISFGQREKLVTRIQGLLKSYPCDSSIMKELLQNADDAGATEINFIKDYRSLSCDNLFSDTCKTMQGPSLCVFNNSYFTQTDIEGIHDLGKGSKSDDPSRTGQYGVGFNAVYHISDTPSFVTKGPGVAKDGLLFIFDPLCRYVPKATRLEPGMMCPVTQVNDNFPGQLLGFSLDQLIGDKTGTIFRFPLRCQESEICKNIVGEKDMDTIIELFKHDMMASMLFLKHIKRITVSIITTERLVEEYSVEVKLSDDDLKKKKSFTDEIRKRCKENSEHKDRLLIVDPIELIYPLKIYVDGALATCWLIVQRFGIENNESDLNNVKKCFRIGDLGLSPIGGVAIPISLRYINRTTFSEINELDFEDSQRHHQFSGRAFCFLPLPVHTGLPVHVNGHFALDHESRRDLWTEGFRMEWNKCVIEHIVIAAWTSGLKFIAQTINPLVVKSKNWKGVNEEMDAYHKLFPFLNFASDRFWRYVACTFYKYIVYKEIRVFPCISKRNIESLSEKNIPENFDVSWEIVSRNKYGDFKGVFNCIPELLEKDILRQRNECFRLESVLKNIGLKLLHAPMLIEKSIIESGIQLSNSATPGLIIEFLRTYSDGSDGACDIGPMNRLISDTKYNTVANLKILMQFLLLDPQFCDKIIGLPLILTEDGVVRKCCTENPVFISEFSSLLPGSSELFLNSIFLPILSPSLDKLRNTGCFKHLAFDKFVELLPSSMSPHIYASGREIIVANDENQESVYTLTMSWLCKFYQYLCNESKPTDNRFVCVDPDRLLHNMKNLNDWSFLPVVNSSGKEVFVPISKMNNILHLPITLSHEKVRCILQKLEIPHINVNVLTGCSEWIALNRCILTYVCSLDQPYRLIKCLLNYEEIVMRHITTCKEGIELLDYFGTSIDILKRECSSKDVLSKELRQLPLYPTVQGTLTALDNDKEILLLHRGIPKDGMQEWANKCNVTLLQERDFNERIRNYLGLNKADVDTMYGEKILPKILALPQMCIGIHVQYLRDKIGKNYLHTTAQQKIIKYLTEIAFIDVNGVMRRANDLYDPDNVLFKQMFANSHFPPANFLTEKWKAFLKMLGLTSKLTNELLIHFARTIESQYINVPINDSIRHKSDILVMEFIADLSNWSESTLYQLRTIRFIAPFREKYENTMMCSQLNNASQLISFKGSISSKHSLLCWSSSNIIPEDKVNKLCKKGKNQLEILESPTVDSVLLHCRNVCQYLKGRAKVESKESIESLMTPFYDFFRINTTFDLSSLVDVHFVHLPDDKELVSINDIVIDLPKMSEIKPYLFRAPTYYGKYHDLFEVLGSKKRAMFYHFANILSKIYSTSVGRELSRPERSFVQNALRELFTLDISNDDTINCVQHLYLPDESMMLKDSKTIVLSNNNRILNRLKGKVNIHLFAGLSFLKMNLCLEDAIQTWPSHLKPLVLTDLVTEVLCLEDSNISPPDSIRFRTIERFMHSRHLVMAICRLIKHQHLSISSNKKVKYDAEYYEKEISQRLCSVQIVPMSSLRTVLKYNGMIITGSEADIQFYIEYEDSKAPRKFLFVDRDNWTSQIYPGLMKLVLSCTMVRLESDSILPIQIMLNEIESPLRFSEILDSHNIKSYDSSLHNEYFPEPGTYVERHFIPFLEQGIKPFAEYEYDNVAMELEDIPIDDEIDTLFIYVRIVDEVSEIRTANTRMTNTCDDLRKMYLVNTGNKNMALEKIPIYRLYRFVRREVEPGALERVCAVAGDTKPSDKQCSILKQELIQAWRLPEIERKRIFRRMLLTWHPDKNLNNREYCSKVFHFLKIIYSRLENGEILVESVEEEIFKGPSHSSQTTAEFYRDVDRRATKQAQAYHNNYDEYSRSTSGGRFSHRTSTKSKAKQGDIMEAQRWLRQAKSDFSAAEAFLSCAEDVPAFNWICKICHQACETALKAAHYFNDRLSVPGMTRQLRYLAPNADLAQQAQLLDNRFGESARLTYPDTPSRPNIPANIFDKADAEYALSTTKEILTMVDDLIS